VPFFFRRHAWRPVEIGFARLAKGGGRESNAAPPVLKFQAKNKAKGAKHEDMK